MKEYTDEEFFQCKLRGANNVINAVFGSPTEDGGKYANIPPSVLEKAAARGKAVHESIEAWLRNDMQGEPIIGLEHQIYIYNFKDWLKNRCTIEEVYGIEAKMISEKLACKGIIDCIAKVKTDTDEESQIAIIDWKTSSSLDLFRTQCQLQLYYELLMEEDPELCKQVTELRTLSITKYEYRWFKFPIDRQLGASILYLYKNYLRCDHA